MIMLGYVHDGTVYLATDTTVVINDAIIKELSSSNYKIKIMQSGLIVGIVGSPTVRQRLLARSDLFTLDRNGKLTKKHIVDKIIPALHGFLSENKLYEVDEDDALEADVNIFLAYEDRLYQITENFWTVRLKKFDAIGVLYRYCRCALNEVEPEGNIGEQLVGIMQRATTYTNYIGGPYLHINTKDRKFNVTEAKQCI